MFDTLTIQTQLQPNDRYQIKPSIIINTIQLYYRKNSYFHFLWTKTKRLSKRHRTKEIKVVTILGI